MLRYRPLARHLARRYTRSPEQREDLEQVAYLGLVKAAQRFDAQRGTAFTTFAMPTVLGELRRYCRDTRWALHVPRPIQERVQELRRFEDDFQARRGRSPSTAQAARALGWSDEAVLEARMAATTLSPRSLNEPTRSAEGTLGEAIDALAQEDAGYAGAELRDALGRALIQLSPRARRALRLRGEEELTTPEIARRMGLSNSQAARLISAALRDLRAALGDADGVPAPAGGSEQPQPGPRSRSQSAEAPATLSFADAAPELFAGLSEDERAQARRLVVAPEIALATGPARLEDATGPDGLGLLVVSGALIRSVAFERHARAELVGPGDLIRPRSGDLERLPAACTRWHVAHPARIAVIDTAVLATLCRWPSVVARLLLRAVRRSEELVCEPALSDASSVDQRVVSLLRSLADGWGEPTPDGLRVPLALSHDDVAHLVAAQRPAVTRALRRLERAQRVRRLADRSWLLPSVARPAPLARAA